MNYDYDTHNLRHSANFRHDIYPGVRWVPINTLGNTRYTKEDILSFTNLSPEEKYLKIKSLYEAVQLFQHGKFETIEDNILIQKDEVNWSFHTQGYNAVLNNCGCCATIANWLYYILYGKYDEIGIITIISNVGVGHAINYLHHQGDFYIIDMTAYLYENKEYVQPETGFLRDYRKNKILTAGLFQVDTLEHFISFYSTFVGRVKRRKFLFCQHSSEIIWEGVRKINDKEIEIFCPLNNMHIIGKPPIEISMQMVNFNLIPKNNRKGKENIEKTKIQKQIIFNS